MRFLKIAVLALFITSLLPLEAFCHDHHEDVQHSHCIVICQSLCHHSVLVPKQFIPVVLQNSSKLFLSKHSVYINPVLPASLRPPIVLS
ncbi:MAG: hypothetical protein KBD53_09845 [Candidatus Omnitrophica bacterium]|nr:hypothetical protein [Candidatus Omnitrophota bacterium]